MTANEILDALASGKHGDFYHAFVGRYSVNLRHWERGLIHSPEYERIMSDTTGYTSVTGLVAQEIGAGIPHRIYF